MRNWVSERDLRQWLWSGRVPPNDRIGMFDYHHPRYRREEMVRDYWRHFGLLSKRDRVISEFGFALPSHEAIEALARLSPLLEIGAGSGYWAALIRRYGGDVVATDLDRTIYPFRLSRHGPVRRIEGRRAVRLHRDRNVLMVWPCYGRPWAYQVAREMAPGLILALVSEGPGGCVGCDNLFEYLDTNFQGITSITIPVWRGIHDRLTLHRKLATPLTRTRKDFWHERHHTPQRQRHQVSQALKAAGRAG